MNGYINVFILIPIFGSKNFRNEIVWQRCQSMAKGSQYGPITLGASSDTIFLYSKSELAKLSNTRPPSEEEIKERFPLIDDNGRRYNTQTPIFRAPSMGPRPNLCFEWRGIKNPHPSGWRLSIDRLEEEFSKGNIVIRKDGKIERRAYAEDYKGIPLGNVWTDIPNIVNQSEKIGYPTAKPEALLERIIKASS